LGASNHDRWVDLRDRHAGAVHAYALRRIGPDDAPDVVAKVFTVAMSRTDRVPDDALPWLYRTAWNVVRNLYRTRSRHARPGPCVGDVDDPAVSVAERDVLLGALASLGDAEREVLMLVAWEGLDHERAAAALGCSVSAFTVKLHRARAKFEAVVSATSEEVIP
jgi:RNA polymerase sigma factor (sigma-70 family)